MTEDEPAVPTGTLCAVCGGHLVSDDPGCEHGDAHEACCHQELHKGH